MNHYIVIGACIVCAVALLMYGYFSRYHIVIKHTHIEAPFVWNIAFISDLHLGKWKDETFLSNVIEKINNQSIEAVLIGGDFLYKPKNIEQLSILFEPFKNIKVPVYAVLGNHDLIRHGENMDIELIKVLKAFDIKIIENTVIPFPEKQYTLIGLGDRWSKNDNVNILLPYLNTKNVVVLTHNPDTTLLYDKNFQGITLAGHTHGGQIRIPWFYKKVIPCKGNFDTALHHTNTGIVFVSSGLGEVGLPLRMFVAPQIEILHFGPKNEKTSLQ